MDVKLLGFKSLIMTVAALLTACQTLHSGRTPNSLGVASAQQIITDPGPAGIAPAKLYTVNLADPGGNVSSSFVYQVNNPLPPSASSKGISPELDTSWTSFSYSGSVTVQVTNQTGLPFQSARILPSSAGISAVVNGNTVSFTLTGQVGQFAVSFCSSGPVCNDANDVNPVLHPMLVFANPVDPSVPTVGSANIAVVTAGTSTAPGNQIPTLGASLDTLYFGPGVYDLAASFPQGYPVNSAQTIYLAAGAYVRGTFLVASNSTQASIRGRGILSGEMIQRNGSVCSITTNGSGTNIRCPNMIGGGGGTSTGISIEGVTLIQSPWYNIQLYGIKNSISNVKIIGWYANTDGIQASISINDPGSSIADTFIKNNDDAVKIMSSNLQVQRVRIWKSGNAGTEFQLGGNVNGALTGVNVSDCDVLRSELNEPGLNPAIFSADYGGNGSLSNWNFSNIRIENSNFQLFKIALRSNPYMHGNIQLGSMTNISFSNIAASDVQKNSDLFQSYNLKNQLSQIHFSGVVAGGVAYPASPQLQYYANRSTDFSGSITSDWLWRSASNPQNFQIWESNLASATPTTPYTVTTFAMSSLTPDMQLVGRGDFFGDGYANEVIQDSSGNIGIWKLRTSTLSSPWTSQYFPLTTLAQGYSVVAVGDFNGDGYSDIAAWNSTAQAGVVYFLSGATVIGTQSFSPVSSAQLSGPLQVVGAGDFDQDGVSDIVLRDSNGNLQILYFAKSGNPTAINYPFSTRLKYSTTAGYKGLSSSVGSFDSGWQVQGIADFQGNGFADILWYNPSTGDLGVTYFDGQRASQAISSRVFYQLSSNQQVAGIGDYNGYGASGLFVTDSSSNTASLLYLGYTYGANLFSPGPTFSSPISSDLVIQP